MSSLAIQAFNLTLQARADRLAQLEPDALRVQAVTAARDMDEAGLWAVFEAFMVLRSSRGARVSVRTLDAYQAGLEALLECAGSAGMSLLRPRGNDGFRRSKTSTYGECDHSNSCVTASFFCAR